MKKVLSLMPLALLLTLGVGTATAQEAEPETQEESPVNLPVHEEIPNPNEIGVLESKSSPAVIRSETTSRSITPVFSNPVPPAKMKNDKQAEKNEDDALSFNFLYYIIQKFKISDLKNN